MLDVLFLLLIFFAMTSSIRATEQLIDVDVPVARTGESEEGRVHETIVNVLNDGRIYVGASETPKTPDQLRRTLAELIASYPNERIIVRGDAEASHGRIMSVYDAARAAGVNDIRVATRPQRPDGGG